MGKEEGNYGARGGGDGAFEIASSRGDASAAEAAAEASTKAAGGEGDVPHPYQLPESFPNLSLSDNYDKEVDVENDDENGGDSNFGRNGERGGGLGSGGMAPA